MKRFTIITLIALLASVSVSAQENQTPIDPVPQEKVDDIDKEMIDLLMLQGEQITAYSKIIQKQRKAFLALQPHQWQQQLALYEETIEVLKSVLTPGQHSRFVGYLGCLIEETRQDALTTRTASR